jgi:hypothetical protein
MRFLSGTIQVTDSDAEDVDNLGNSIEKGKGLASALVLIDRCREDLVEGVHQ